MPTSCSFPMFFTNVHHGYSYNTLHIMSSRLHAKIVRFWKLACFHFQVKGCTHQIKSPFFLIKDTEPVSETGDCSMQPR